ncbi:class I SAM-dependent DNA methyltransferase [Nonomuraea sp. NPDC049709]|uniref:class I SAM-dependent DNA methyltransferase n=1 Tax=Nonomuraea sp. NPDC049709 TaxID=3154736 RepID=UPI00344997CA
MSTDFGSFTNRGEYFSAHYFAEQLGTDLKKGLLATWTTRESDENDPRRTPRELLRTLRAPYLTEKLRGYFAESAQADAEDEGRFATYNNAEWTKRLAEWHQMVLHALGYDATSTELTVYRAGRDHTLTVAYHGHGIIALDCGWSDVNDAALNANGAGRLLSPLRVNVSESYETGAALASWLFQSELGEVGGPRPRFILLLCGGVILLADRQVWSEGRYLAANLDAALERNDRTQQGELTTIAALFSLDMLRPCENDQSRAIDALLKSSGDNAVGVSSELRHGLQRSVEIIANEVLHRMAEPKNAVTPADIESSAIPFARELTREALRYLYRILFLLYAEARPELGVLPADDGSYEAGYSIARLRELVERNEELVEEEARKGFHLFASLDVLFNKVNFGHREYGTEPDDDQPGDDEETRKVKAARRSEDRGLRFEPLRSELFEPTAIRLIGNGVLDPRSDYDHEPRWLDLRLRNEALHKVLRLLTMKKGKRGERGGFISYRNLGINQLGAVYEGLMSYTGIIADEELCEVARGGNPEQGSWLIPLREQDQYPDTTLVHYGEDDARKGLRGPKKYGKGSFVYRLSGRQRETSASYYTPESLTKVTVELTLKNRLDQERDEHGEVIKTRASELLKYKICEPALGSGAFLNEAINQVADEYLRRRQEELGTTIPTAAAITEKQKVKAYIALHNAYGVDLNATGVELAEVSLWLNTMHPGMRAPWFGLHLRRGNSLIGARRAVYAGYDVASKEKGWLKGKGALAPTPLPFLKDGDPQPLPEDAVHQFLLPSPGWAAVAGATEAKELGEKGVAQLADWKKGILQRPQRSTAHINKDGSPKRDPKTKQPKQEARSQFTRLRDAARRVEFLWAAVVKRMMLSEMEIARRIDVWQADPADPEYAFLQYPVQAVAKEKVLEDLFNAVDTPYWRLKMVMDAWCALWFWPIDKAGLLDGTDGEYVARTVVGDGGCLSDVLGGLPRTEERAKIQETPERLPVPASAPPPRFVEAMALFAVGPEQTSIWDLGSATDDDAVVELKKVGPTGTKKEAKPKSLQKRQIVPLKELDDWLEFLEAMLGTADVPEGTLLDASKSLDELKEFEETIPHFMGMDLGNPEDRFPWLRAVRDIAKEQGFLHWELEFALVFANGGFDLQVGNPPWVQPKWNSASELAEFDPWFAVVGSNSHPDAVERRSAILANESACAELGWRSSMLSGVSSFIGSEANYPENGTDQTDLYLAFISRVWQNAHHLGISGMVHSEAHLSSEGFEKIRSSALHRLRIHCHFVNGGHWAFPKPVGHTTQFGVHIYGPPGEISFLHLSNLYHSSVVIPSLRHDGSGDAPGIMFNGSFDLRPHRKRVIHVTPELLLEWQELSGQEEECVGNTVLFNPVTTAETGAMNALRSYSLRLGAEERVSSGFNETTSERRGLIAKRHTQPPDWDDVILSGPHISVSSPIAKQSPGLSSHGKPIDLRNLPTSFVPATAFRITADTANYRAALKCWNGIPYTRYARVAWRKMRTFDMERCFNVALLPPGPAHVDGIYSMSRGRAEEDLGIVGFWSSLPIEYIIRLMGKKNLHDRDVRKIPVPSLKHPLHSALTLRAARLNCLTEAYASAWAEAYNDAWGSDSWVYEKECGDLSAVGEEWTVDAPLRSERARRAALVELDAISSVILGIDADALCSIYQARFPLLFSRESEMWFDVQGRRIAKDSRVFGAGQTVEDYGQFLKYDSDPTRTPPPYGYFAPFYRANREAEMREAHAVFQKRLDEAVSRGEWDPAKQEVSK